jgi:hypothetical protein
MRPEKWLNSREELYVSEKERCAHCGGSFGLIVHRSGQLRFCSLAHKATYDLSETTSPDGSPQRCFLFEPQA